MVVLTCNARTQEVEAGTSKSGHPDLQHDKMKPVSKIKDRVLAGEMVLDGIRI